MDQRERIADNLEATRALIEDFLANVWTALPAIVQSFDPTHGTVVVQPTVQIRVRQANGKVQWTTMKQLADVPVLFPQGGGMLVTMPIAAGDECLVVFSCRCIDSWWQQGGVQKPFEIRIQDLSDGFAIVGPYSVPRLPANINPTAMELRTVDRSAYIQLTPGGVVNIVAPGGVNVTGALGATGEVTAKVGAGNHTVSAHIHGGVTPGGGNTGGPTG